MIRILALLWALAAPAAHATTVVRMDLDDQAAESAAFVEAVVGDSQVVVTERLVFTDYDLTIVRAIGGDAPTTTVKLRTVGGEANGRVVKMDGQAELRKGDRIAAFVHPGDDGRWVFTALAQSVWHIDGEGPKARVERDFEGLHMMERSREGNIVPSLESPVEFTDLSELEAATKGLAFGGAL